MIGAREPKRTQQVTVFVLMLKKGVPSKHLLIKHSVEVNVSEKIGEYKSPRKNSTRVVGGVIKIESTL